MPEPTTTDPLDAELRRVAHALVADAPTAPPFPSDLMLAGARQGPSRPRPWRTVALTAAAALALVAGVVAVLRAPSEEGADKAETGPGAEPANRLVVRGHEIREDGAIVPVAWAFGPVEGGWPTPGGGVALMDGPRISMDEDPAGRPRSAVLMWQLVVLDAGGRVVFTRETEDFTLVGVTTTEVILERAAGDGGATTVVAQDMQSGRERVVREGGGPAGRTQGGTVVADDTLVSVQNHTPAGSESGMCRLVTLDLTTGEETIHPLSIGCEFVDAQSVSADGSRVAVSYQAVAARPPDETLRDQRVAVIDLATGTAEFDEHVGYNTTCDPGGDCPPGVRPMVVTGIAWDGPGWLRLASFTRDHRFDREVVVQQGQRPWSIFWAHHMRLDLMEVERIAVT